MSPARRTDRDLPGGVARMQTQTLFAKRVRQWRQAQDAPRRVLAAQLGVTEQTLLNWESGRVPSFDALARLVEVSGISGDYWLGVSDVKRPAR